MSQSSTSASVTKTAYDALLAKYSALMVGYEIPSSYRTGNDTYKRLLEKVIDNDNTDHGDEVGKSVNEKKKNRPKRLVRQQIPLVNAGYASRMICMKYLIEKFVFHHSNHDDDHHKEKGREKPNEKNYSTNNDEENNKRRKIINIVMLGCGLEVLGLWAHSLLAADNKYKFISSKVYEIDCPEICDAKRDMFESKGLLKLSTSPPSQSSTSPSVSSQNPKQKNELSIVAKGVIDLSTVGEKESTASYKGNNNKVNYDNYILISGDLRNSSSWNKDERRNDGEDIVLNKLIDVSHPTLVISELVLAYLGCQGTNDLLQYCSSKLCNGNSKSAMIVYEPLGVSGELDGELSSTIDNGIGDSHQVAAVNDEPRVLSVLDGYKLSYSNKFKSKLQRGQQKQQDMTTGKNGIMDKDNDKKDVFHPLGKDCEDVEKRFELAGFSSCYACYAGTMTSIIASGAADANVASFLQPPEPFDEYADLTLHLRTYSVVCAFASPHKSTTIKLKRQLCPWSRNLLIDDSITFTTTASATQGREVEAESKKINISIIEKTDQERVRDLYRETYEELFDTYPAVKKMVKTALKTDLSGKMDNSITINNSSTESSIGNRYKKWGGIFIVATTAATNENSVGPSDSTNTLSLDSISSKIHQRRVVVGCIGLRPCKKSEGNIRGSSCVNTYEIHRLAVDATYRGKGIGKSLLLAAHRYVSIKQYLIHQKTIRRRQQQQHLSYNLVATTPAILHAANQLYETAGFRLIEEVNMGKMKMNTYRYAKSC